MATSGSIDFGITARQAVDFALKKLRVLGSDETATGEDADTAQRELNLMLKGWQKYESLWRLTEGSITLVADDVDYSLSPVPHRVVSARYRDASATPNDLPLEVMTREEYYDLPNKTTAGSPHSYYVDYQRSAVTFYVWQPLASVTTETIKYTFQRKFEDIDSLDNDIDVDQEWLEVVGYNLASRLVDDFGRSGESVTRIIARAEQLREEMLDDDREDFVQFVPGM
jgi:hypothetical protein